ncbi:hypothetical protein GCM10028784_35080 [Myceligenerans cantabricum]
MTPDPAPPSDAVADGPPAPASDAYDLRKRLRLMGAILAGGVAAVLAMMLWLGVAVPARQAAEGYNDADRVFAQVMSEHNAQAAELASLAPNRSENPEVLELAHDVGTESAVQADALAVWLTDRRIPVPASVTTVLALVEAGGLDGAGDDGSGDGSGPRAPAGLQHAHGTDTDHGMLTPEQVEQMAGLRGTEFDGALVGALIEHHYGGLQPADEQIEDGMDPEAIELAEAERERIRGELDVLQEALAGL